MTQPKEMTVRKKLKELSISSDIIFAGEFSAESMKFHRAVFAENYATEFSFVDRQSGGETDCITFAWHRRTAAWRGRARSGCAQVTGFPIHNQRQRDLEPATTRLDRARSAYG